MVGLIIAWLLIIEIFLQSWAMGGGSLKMSIKLQHVALCSRAVRKTMSLTEVSILRVWVDGLMTLPWIV